jgi:hypothetical protein
MMKTMEYNITTADGETHKGGITIKKGHSFTSAKIINNIKEIVGQEFIDVFDVDNECEIKKCYGKGVTTNNFMVMVKEDDGKLKAGMFLVEDMYSRSSSSSRCVIHIKRITDKYAIYDEWRRAFDIPMERRFDLICVNSNRKRLIREKKGFEYIGTGGYHWYNINYLIKEGNITDGNRRHYDKLVNDIKGKKPPIRLVPPRVEDNYMFPA